MQQSRSQIRSPFKQANSSSSSLEGMEKPVRSFKSFIKTVPPNPPTQNKPLPPAPSPAVTPPSPHSSISTLSSTGRNPSVTSWKAPTDWSNSSQYRKESLQTPPIPSGRSYSPLLPEPSPDLSDMTMEVRVAQKASSLPQERLLPIYERPNLPDLGPPRTPPRSPLPSPPNSGPRDDKQLLLLPRRSPPGKRAEIISWYTPLQTEFMHRMASPVASVASNASIASTKEKAFASLGIDSPREQTQTLENKFYEPTPSPSPDPTWRDHSNLRRKKLRALNKGSPLAEDSWEDTEMDDKTRQLSFSQDYHNLLADQYQEMSVKSEEVTRHGTPVNGKADHSKNINRPKRPPRDFELVPSPLSWNKSSTNSSLRSKSMERERTEEHIKNDEVHSKEEKRRSRTVALWVPHRLSIGPKRQVSKRRSPKVRNELKQKRIPESEVDKQIQKDLRFSKFFPPSKPKSGKKLKLNGAAKSNDKTTPPITASPYYLPAPFIRLPAGLAVVRTTHSRSNTPALPSPTKPPSEHHYSSQHASNVHNNPDYYNSSPTSLSYPSSYTSQTSQSVAPIAPTIAISKLHSGTSSSHPLAQEITPPPPPPTSSHSPYTHVRKQSRTSATRPSPDTGPIWRRFRGADDEEWYKPSFLEKARQVRRRHAQETRQERLKKSIRVLGPTDPGVVQQDYVGRGNDGGVGMGSGVGARKPGYLGGG